MKTVPQYPLENFHEAQEGRPYWVALLRKELEMASGSALENRGISIEPPCAGKAKP